MNTCTQRQSVLVSSLRTLSDTEIACVGGGDNPGMGSYDGNGDNSAPNGEGYECHWVNYGGGMDCTIFF